MSLLMSEIKFSRGQACKIPSRTHDVDVDVDVDVPLDERDKVVKRTSKQNPK